MNIPQTEENTLKRFGNVFQTKCLSVLLTDRAFLEQISDILSPDFFDNDASKWIVTTTMAYFEKYRTCPTTNVCQLETGAISNPILQAATIEQMTAAYGHMTDTDIKYVKEQFLKFCKNQKLKKALHESTQLLKTGDYDGIWTVINDASKAGMERNLGSDYENDFDERMSELARPVIKTNWEIIDKHLDGGLGKGELGFIVAPAGSGKSWFLTHIGVEALKQGKNVMHFTMELNEKYVERRYDACFTETQFQEVVKSKDKVKAVLNSIKGRGRLFVKYFPMHIPTAIALKAHVEREELIRGLKIDLMIIDYADLLRPMVVHKNSNSYEEGGSIYGELRSVLGELQIPGWSASQANRDGHEGEIVGATNVADSYKKIMIGDFIMSLSRTMADKDQGTGRNHIIKSRFGSDGSVYPCKFDASMGKIDIYDKTSVEGIELMEKTKTAQDAVNNMLHKAWAKTKSKYGNDTE